MRLTVLRGRRCSLCEVKRLLSRVHLFLSSAGEASDTVPASSRIIALPDEEDEDEDEDEVEYDESELVVVFPLREALHHLGDGPHPKVQLPLSDSAKGSASPVGSWRGRVASASGSPGMAKCWSGSAQLPSERAPRKCRPSM